MTRGSWGRRDLAWHLAWRTGMLRSGRACCAASSAGARQPGGRARTRPGRQVAQEVLERISDDGHVGVPSARTGRAFGGGQCQLRARTVQDRSVRFGEARGVARVRAGLGLSLDGPPPGSQSRRCGYGPDMDSHRIRQVHQCELGRVDHGRDLRERGGTPDAGLRPRQWPPPRDMNSPLGQGAWGGQVWLAGCWRRWAGVWLMWTRRSKSTAAPRRRRSTVSAADGRAVVVSPRSARW